MEIVIQPDSARVAQTAAGAIIRLLQRNPDAVLGLATGSSPLGVYGELIVAYQKHEISFARCRAFMLDEYVGLASHHPERYRRVISRELEDHVDFAPGAVQGPDGLAGDIDAACADYERAITDAGDIDLQLLGIGTDGHVAFNEPGSSLSSRTRVKTLTAQTRRDNARFFATLDEVPYHVLTQGLGTISRARHLVLVATGEAKAEAVHAMVEGAVAAWCPASVLQLHPHATVVLDEAAASRLKLADYYRETYAGKPDWQLL